MTFLRNIIVALCVAMISMPVLAEPSDIAEPEYIQRGFNEPSYDNFTWHNENKFAFGIFRVEVEGGTKDIFVYEGEITENTTEIIKFFHEQYPEITEIAFNSPGGNAYESFELGEFLSVKGFSVTVPAGRICLSACAFAFIGGKDYLVDGVLGFHSSWLSIPQDQFTLDQLNGAYGQGQLIGTQMTIWFMQNGFTPYLGLQTVYRTNKDKFLIFTHEDELYQWYTRNNNREETDDILNYLYPEDITEEILNSLKVMHGGEIMIYVQSTASHSNRGRIVLERLGLWVPTITPRTPAVPE